MKTLKNKPNKIVNLINSVALLATCVFLILLGSNIRNRVAIIDSLNMSAGNAVSFDAKLQCPLILAALAIIVSLVLSKGKISRILLMILVALAVGIFVWGFGLEFALTNQFQN